MYISSFYHISYLLVRSLLVSNIENQLPPLEPYFQKSNFGKKNPSCVTGELNKENIGIKVFLPKKRKKEKRRKRLLKQKKQGSPLKHAKRSQTRNENTK